MTETAPVRYRADIESIGEDESQTIDELMDTFDRILERTAEDYGEAVRAVHAKSHGILEGTLRIEPDLPPASAQGLFARPGEYPVYMRLSTNAGDLLPDAVSLPRGLAMKVCDVAGERLPGPKVQTRISSCSTLRYSRRRAPIRFLAT